MKFNHKIILPVFVEYMDKVVAELLAEGWQLLGGLTVSVAGIGKDGAIRELCQAMTRYEEKS